MKETKYSYKRTHLRQSRSALGVVVGKSKALDG